MNLSLDYDGTYTRDPDTWDKIVQTFKEAGHKVYLVTMRYDVPKEADEVRKALEGKVDGIFFTGRKAKQKFMYEQKIDISVWMDDMPIFINQDVAY